MPMPPNASRGRPNTTTGAAVTSSCGRERASATGQDTGNGPTMAAGCRDLRHEPASEESSVLSLAHDFGRFVATLFAEGLLVLGENDGLSQREGASP